MLVYIKKYPLSLLIVAIILYLSFFTPPKTDLDEIPNIDKLIHIGMYLGLAGMLWLEYLKSHKQTFNLKHVLIGALLCPILLSGCIEVGQEYLTENRSGDWMDLAANTIGAVLAAIIGYYVLRPRIIR